MGIRPRVKIIDDPRGLPRDPSIEVVRYLMESDPEASCGHSWLRLSEIVPYDWRKIPYAECVQTMIFKLKYFCREVLSIVRVLFWFDKESGYPD